MQQFNKRYSYFSDTTVVAPTLQRFVLPNNSVFIQIVHWCSMHVRPMHVRPVQVRSKRVRSAPHTSVTARPIPSIPCLRLSALDKYDKPNITPAEIYFRQVNSHSCERDGPAQGGPTWETCMRWTCIGRHWRHTGYTAKIRDY